MTTTDLMSVSDPDHAWAIERMDLWHGTVLEAGDVAEQILANWDEGRNISRFWDGRDLTDVLRERYPELGQRRAEQLLAAAQTRTALPELTEGMSERALREVPSVTERTTVRSVGGKVAGSRTKVSPTKVKQAKAVLTKARKLSGGKTPTPAQLRQVQLCAALVPDTDLNGKPSPMLGQHGCKNKSRPGSKFCGLHDPSKPARRSGPISHEHSHLPPDEAAALTKADAQYVADFTREGKTEVHAFDDLRAAWRTLRLLSRRYEQVMMPSAVLAIEAALNTAETGLQPYFDKAHAHYYASAEDEADTGAEQIEDLDDTDQTAEPIENEQPQAIA